MTALRKRFLTEFPKAVIDDAAAIFVGAGVSVGAGYPSWKELLKEIGAEIGVDSADVQDLAALAQWSIQQNTNRTRILRVIKESIQVDHPVPEPLKIISRMPVRSVWTTNYDRLIERAYAEIGRPVDVISEDDDLALRPNPGAVRLYKMHGDINRLNTIVISTDDYELYRRDRGAFLPMLQAHLTSFSVLFVGISFADPNVRHVLSIIRESFKNAPPEHFAILRPPQKRDFKSKTEYESKLIQHNLWTRDLQRYGLVAIEIEDYDEVPELMRLLERRIASNRVWVSGSWPPSDPDSPYIGDLAKGLGLLLGQAKLALVTGSGLTVGAKVVEGFLTSLQSSGSWDLERRLIVRPFPQPDSGKAPDRAQWNALRDEMARITGICVFLGGMKIDSSGSRILADGVQSEREIAEKYGAFLLPIGAAGGMAAEIAESLIGSSISHTGAGALRPHDKELRALITEKEPSKIYALVKNIIDRIIKASD